MLVIILLHKDSEIGLALTEFFAGKHHGGVADALARHDALYLHAWRNGDALVGITLFNHRENIVNRMIGHIEHLEHHLAEFTGVDVAILVLIFKMDMA